MITGIDIIGLKSFKSKFVPLRNLTLICGYNNTGKSTVLQSLRMLCESYEGHSPLLHGHGSFDEMRSRLISSNDPIEINCHYSNSTVQKLVLARNSISRPQIAPIVSYLSADRWGPKVSLPLDRQNETSPSVGEHGENVVLFLQKLANATIPELLHHANSQGNTLAFEIGGWLSEIAPGVTLSYDSDTKRDTSHTEFNSFRPTNVGFGLSYCLPILAVVLGMAAKEPKLGWEEDWAKKWFEQRELRGLVVLIENPEAHLHPRGQTALGHLIALGSKCGVQFVIETQSDHLIDGIRIAVKDGVIDPNEVLFHYFTLTSEFETQIETPEVHKNGKLSSWPDGFFDQTLKNRVRLAR